MSTAPDRDKMADEEAHVTLVLSCIPGFEAICLKECSEIFGKVARKDQRGRICVEISRNDLPKAVSLRSVHHYWVVVKEIEDFVSIQTGCSDDEFFSKVEKMPLEINWESSLENWRTYKFSKEVQLTKSRYARLIELANLDSPSVEVTSEVTSPKSDPINAESKDINARKGNIATPTRRSYHTRLDSAIDFTVPNDKVRFRVTCNRTGKHTFTSMEIAKWFGSGIKEKFGWEVNLTEYDVEIVLYILDSKLTIGIQLTSEGQDRRNLTRLGPTTLRSTISYCLLKCADVKKGDVVCDPMCGSGSICVESVLSLPYNFHIGGDNHPDATLRTVENFSLLEKCEGECRDTSDYGLPYSAASWDVCHLPLRDGCVDVFVSDMPFGKKVGKKQHNWGLYRSALHEMARAAVLGSARAVVITQHRQAMTNAMSACGKLWTKKDLFQINMGGLKVIVYLLNRTTTPADSCDVAGRVRLVARKRKHEQAADESLE